MLRLIQINLHHSKAASAALCRLFLACNIDVALIQEPWVNGGKVLGLRDTGARIIYDQGTERPRTCLLVNRRLEFLALTEYCSQDLTAVRMMYYENGNLRSMIVASAYFPWDSPTQPPSLEFKKLVDHSKLSKLQLLTGIDANAHNEAWGSTNTNSRGECLLDYFVVKDLSLLNEGSEPTFITKTRKEVIDITVASSVISTQISGWHVSEEPSHSDHRFIYFEVLSADGPRVSYRNPRKTNWGKYKKILTSKVSQMNKDVRNILDIERVSINLEAAIGKAYEDSCPMVEVLNKKTSWWTDELARLRRQTRWLFNRAKLNKDWDAYYQSLKSYNKAIRTAKRVGWRNFCQEVDKTSEASRLQKIIAKEPILLGTLKRPGGGFTESGKDTMEVLLQTHFPESVIKDSRGDSPGTLGIPAGRPKKEDWAVAKKVVSYNKIEWAIGTFKPYKAAGADNIFPALLQQGKDIIIPILCRLFRACIASSYAPKSWRNARVVFIPKPGKSTYKEPKAFRPITLSSFALKTLEKLVDNYIRRTSLKERPLHRNQHAYQVGKSCESALHQMVARIENTIIHKEAALGAFLDIEGAFDNTSFDAMIQASYSRGIESTLCRWIEAMLKGRTVSITMFGETVRAKVMKGCPQGGVLSPLLWNLVVDGLLNTLNDKGYFSQGYADDLVILIQGKYLNTISEVMQSALKEVESWCGRVNLKVNPSKTTLVPFTLKRKLEELKPPVLCGERLTLAGEVKYLGIILDTKLTWNPHLEKLKQKCIRTLMVSRRAFGKSWGLKPRVMDYLYRAVIRPMITYNCVVWWPKIKQRQAIELLGKIQRLGCLCITSAMSSAPTLGLETLLGLEPLDIHIKGRARMAAYRLKLNNTWRAQPYGHSSITALINSPVLEMGTDCMSVETLFDNPVKVTVEATHDWPSKERQLLSRGAIVWYTDGSRTENGSGAGIHCVKPRTDISLSLGTFASVYQAEIMAICTCAGENIKMGLTHKEIHIFSDSQAALKAIKSYKTNSKITWECQNTLLELARNNRVHLGWVPGHRGIVGNEKADQLAKTGSTTPFVGPEPVVGINKAEVRSIIARWTFNSHQAVWDAASGLRHSKAMMQGPSKSLTMEVLALSRRNIRIATGLITGHCALRKHLHTMGFHQDQIMCRLCGEDEETASHVIFECNSLLTWRLSTGMSNPRQDIHGEHLAKRLLRLAQSLNLS